MSKFAPLSTTELETAATVTPFEQADAGEFIAPIPSDAPPPPSRHSRYGEPVARWPYHEEAGHVAFIVCRFEPVGERKQIVPLSLWRDGLGQRQWRWKSPPSPRALYNLDKLYAKPDVGVIVVEGEPCADAAGRIFPKSVSTTSPGGSMAAGKADWSPLAGRRVLIWPDADAPGAKYAREVAETLAGLGCEVSIIDATALAAIAPDGSKREVEPGWDAADAAKQWPDPSALAKTAWALAKPFEAYPIYLSHGPFTMEGSGLYVEAMKGRGNAAETVQEWVCGPFEVLGATRDPNGRDWGKWLRWRDGDGREHLRHVADSALQGDPASLAASLACDGLRVNRSHQKALSSYLCGVSTKGRVTVVARTGWHAIGGRDVFVLPNETIGPKGAETVILNAAAVGPYDACGSLADWQKGVGSLVRDHALGVLAVSAALAGPLLHLAGQEGGGLNFFGPSSKGKSTIAQAGGSGWGRGGSPGFVRAWRATVNGLEGAAASATDTLLVLDELGVVEARDAAAAVYGLSNGSGKARAARDGSLREPKSWRVFLLSTGEIPIAAKLMEDRGRRARAGQMVRLLDIPADRGLGFGAFDNAGPDGDPAVLSKSIKLAAQSNYGTAGPEFVRRLISEGVDGATVRAMVTDFVAAEIAAGADGQVSRAAERLGLVMAAGELATALGVVPWRKGAAREAAAWALGQWIAGRGGTEPAEVRQAIETVRLLIQQHGQSRFEPLDYDDYREVRPVSNRLGWRTGSGPDAQWLIPGEVWRSEVCAGLDFKFVAKVLGERGMLERAGDGWQPVRRIGGRSTRVYVVHGNIFEGAGDGA
jgi:putative DNA primase/helicase